MDIEEHIREWKTIYSPLLAFIESIDDSDDKFKSLKETLMKTKVFQKKEEFLELILLISKITDNHYRPHDFINKIEKILIDIFKNINFSISISEIMQITDINKLILFIILDKKIIIIDPSDNDEKKAVQNVVEQNKTLLSYLDYLSPILSSYIDEKNPNLLKISNKEENYLQKCRKGVNDEYICSLIRDDLGDSFVEYINKNNLSISSRIKRSCYETNLFLMNNETSYIEYAAFYGSIAIFKYLINNDVKMTEKLWYYAIHSQNAELIQLLIEQVPLEKYDDILIESIKCHHNEISNYIKYDLMNIKNDEKLNENFDCAIVDSRNFDFYPDKISNEIFEKPRNDRCFNISNLSSPMTKLTIPTSVTKIGNFAFKGCFSLKEVVFHSSIKSVGIRIFDGLKTIKITGEIEKILNDLFVDCSSLEEVILPENLKEIGDDVFNGCSSLKYVSLLSNIMSIRGNVFRSCSSLREVVLPQKLKEIGDDVFNGCSSLEKIEIPESVTYIGSSCFMYCYSLKEITIPKSVTEIKRKTFYDCKSLQKVTIPSTVTSIGDFAFNGCLQLEEISIPPCVNYIGEFAFSRCCMITEVSIPKSVKLIKNHCFSACKSLRSIKLTSSITLIERNAFYNCSSLIKFDMPSSVTELGEYAFSGCSSLVSIKLSPLLESINDFTFNCCTALKEIENIPQSLRLIGKSAFKNCSSLVNLKIPSTVTDIGDSAFYGCSSLTGIEIPLNLTSIKHSTFRNNISLKEIKIPSSIESVGVFSFYGCTSLEHIKIPSNIKDTSFIEPEFVGKIVKVKV